MNKFKNVIIILFILILMFFVVRTFLKQPNLMPVKEQMEKINLSNINKLMIVSHPGDESVWGGVHLLSDDYLVVCVSCGYDKNNTDNFIKTMNYSNDSIVMLGYSDKFYLNRDYNRIKKQIKYILNYKNWSEVITHNPDGEYGNYQHKQINKIVSDFNLNNLYYFGKYYSEKELDKMDKETILDGKLLKNKINNMVNIYDGLDDYNHMLPFEEWMGASEWKS